MGSVARAVVCASVVSGSLHRFLQLQEFFVEHVPRVTAAYCVTDRVVYCEKTLTYIDTVLVCTSNHVMSRHVRIVRCFVRMHGNGAGKLPAAQQPPLLHFINVRMHKIRAKNAHTLTTKKCKKVLNKTSVT